MASTCLQRGKALGAADLLFNLQSLNDGGKLAQDLIGLLVVLDLGGDEFGEVTERLRGVDDLAK